LATTAEGQIRTYVADLDAKSVTIAWGRTIGAKGNTIGREAVGSGKAELRIDGRVLTSTGSWQKVEGLRPDRAYPYTLTVDGAQVAQGSVRTWPEKTDSLTFFVIGDFGNGSARQRELALRLEEERVRRENAGQRVRFVISTGDNVYGKFSASGARDRDWDKKFFAPYENTLRAIPFKAVLGNHDGNESENPLDLDVCLDNFFMPGRWYRFGYGAFAEFVALDSTKNQAQGPAAPLFLAEGEQSKWLAGVMKQAPFPWRIVIMHHPMFTAGPNHEPFLHSAPHWFEMMKGGSVQAVFSGHEHNMQVSERSEATGNMQFFLSGAGGELRASDVRKKMAPSHIALWSNQNHFLVVTIQGKEMTVEPIGIVPMRLWAPQGPAAEKVIRLTSNR